jgi:hypothetical protein
MTGKLTPVAEKRRQGRIPLQSTLLIADRGLVDSTFKPDPYFGKLTLSFYFILK